MRSEPQKGAAMFRNRITTMQHAELCGDPDPHDGRRGAAPIARRG